MIYSYSLFINIVVSVLFCCDIYYLLHTYTYLNISGRASIWMGGRLEYPVQSHCTGHAVQSGFQKSFSWLYIVLRKMRKIEVNRCRCDSRGDSTILSRDCLYLVRQKLESRCQQLGTHSCITTNTKV